MKPRARSRFDPKTFLTKIGKGRTISDYRKIKLTVVSSQGKEAVVRIPGPGDFFGEACLAGQKQRIARASTLTDCRIVRLGKRAATRVIRDEPEFSELFLAYVLSRNIRVEEDLVDQPFNSSEKRLARVLLILANFGKEGTPELMIPKMSQGTLAEIVGTTRSRVNLHEQVPKIRLSRLQRRDKSSRFAPQLILHDLCWFSVNWRAGVPR